MKFSLVDGFKQAPLPKMKGVCIYCCSPTVAKCGSKIRWHWAHKVKCSCDPWWDNESQWHRDWKNHWEDHNREIVYFDKSGEKHIADVVNEQNIVIEFQNSPMSEAELKSREDFYGDMIWVINGRNLAKNIKLRAMLPDPLHESMEDISIHSSNHKTHFVYSFISEYRGPNELVEIHSSDKIDGIIKSTHVGHFLFDWKRPRYVWFKATKPVYLDFGQGVIWQLMRFNNYSSFCIKACIKNDFLAKFK